jgi:hypothetical protein
MHDKVLFAVHRSHDKVFFIIILNSYKLSNKFETFSKLPQNELCCLLLIEKVLKSKHIVNVTSSTNLTMYFLTV